MDAGGRFLALVQAWLAALRSEGPEVPFLKMHGLGNDFVVMAGAPVVAALDAQPAWARAIAARHVGVGCDQIVVIERASVSADAVMSFWNSDGSRAGACGNATRCVAALLMATATLHARKMIVTNPEDEPVFPLGFGSASDETRLQSCVSLAVRTVRDGRFADSAPLVCTLAEDSAASDEVDLGASVHVAVDMGCARLRPQEIPLAVPDAESTLAVTLDGVADDLPPACCVSMGNPHAVFFVPYGAAIELATLGPLVEHHRLFPQRCNATWASVRPSAVSGDGPALTMDARVWERGAGATRACGTAACAVAVAAWRGGLLELGCTARVHLPGGALDVTVLAGPGGPGGAPRVRMAGAAAVSYLGVLLRSPAHTHPEASVPVSMTT
jgi:diaminopimelate epimerase